MSPTARASRLWQGDGAATLLSLAALCVLAWLYVLSGARLGASAASMTTLSFFPHRQALVASVATPAPPATDMSGMPGMSMPATPTPLGLSAPAWTPSLWVLVIAMWWIMMIAMMTPSAAAAVLLYERIYRHSQLREAALQIVAPTWAFAAGYFAGWLGFAVLAAAVHWSLQRAGLLSAAMMDSQSRALSGGLLMAAGLYQLSPLKTRCLAHCRTPAAFFSHHWRARIAGALRLGLLHSMYCVGCCWVLMALLFVGGVMNLAWILGLTALVLIEKIVPGGMWIGRIVGLGLVAWSVATWVS